ncbi:MAG TPA: ATP-binding protein, partial [Bryobacteraceae bacterium]|nr:ATP-binding protein [Bryobacteraceae bacterium]
ITKDLTGIITTWNRAAEELLGYTAAQAVGQSIAMIAPAERIPEIAQLLTRIGKGERIAHFETQRKTRDGRILDVALTISPIRDREGNIVGASKIMRDITGRKRAERERLLLLEREQHARATAELLNQVGPLLLAERDPERLAQAITDIAAALIGAESGCFIHNAVGPNDQGRAPRVIRSGPQQGSPSFPPAADSELAARTLRDGQVVRLSDLGHDPASPGPQPAGPQSVRSYLAAPVVLRSGEILGALFFAHSAAAKFAQHEEDLTRGIAAQAAIALDNARLFEQAQWAQQELQRSNEELRRTNEDLEAFVYSASHDLKEPLRTITLCSELAQRSAGGQLPQEAAGFLAGAIHGARTMDQLIKDLLAYTTAARSAEGPPPVIDSEAVFREVLEALKASIDQAGASVTSAALPQVSMHPARLAQVLQNLISNALKYRGSGAPHIHVSAAEKDGWIVFSVEDNGIGIEPGDSNRIFGLFKRLHSREQYPGSGLGLAICQRIVEHYGGRIWLDKSTVGSGSVFCFSVPVRGGRPIPEK